MGLQKQLFGLQPCGRHVVLVLPESNRVDVLLPASHGANRNKDNTVMQQAWKKCTLFSRLP